MFVAMSLLFLAAAQSGDDQRKPGKTVMKHVTIPVGAVPPGVRVNNKAARMRGTEVTVERRPVSSKPQSKKAKTSPKNNGKGGAGAAGAAAAAAVQASSSTSSLLPSPLAEVKAAPGQRKEVFNNQDFAPVNSTNVAFDCSHNGLAMCCPLVQPRSRPTKALGVGLSAGVQCQIKKVYALLAATMCSHLISN